MESRNRRVFVAQIPLIRTIGSLLSVSPGIPWYSAWLYQQSHFLRIERTCHLTICFHPNSVSSIQDEAWTTYANCLLSNIERLLIEKCLGGIPRTSEHDPLQFPWHEFCSLAPCKYFWGSTRNPFLLAYCRIFCIYTWAPARCGRWFDHSHGWNCTIPTLITS
jgi:hypothetical protein